MRTEKREIADLGVAYGVAEPNRVEGAIKLGAFEIADGFLVIYDNGVRIQGTPVTQPVDYDAYMARERQWVEEGALPALVSRPVRVGRFSGVGSAAGFNGSSDGRSPRPAYVDWYDSGLGIRFQIYLPAEGTTLGQAVAAAQMVKSAAKQEQ